MSACAECERYRRVNEEWRKSYSILWHELDDVRRAMNLLDSQASDLKHRLDVSERDLALAKARLLAGRHDDLPAEEHQ